MGKNTKTEKAASPAKPAVKAATTKPPAPRKGTAAPAKQAKSALAKAQQATKPKAVKRAGVTAEDIALRAYFIAEKRRHNGLPGDEHHDWIEAERQLRAERATPR